MNKFLRHFFVLIFLLGVSLNATTSSQSYFQCKINYLRATLDNNSYAKKKALKQLIYLGKKLRLNVSRYELELRRTSSKEHKNTSVSSLYSTIKTSKTKTKTHKSYSSKYSILQVYTRANNIIIVLNKNVRKNDLNFFELHYKHLNKDIFDIKGNFKRAKETKLRINKVHIVVAQFRKDILRIVLSNRVDLNTKLHIYKNKITIQILGLKSKKVSTRNYINFTRSKLIIIDPGHGGKDTGAIGYKHRYEKYVVFKIGVKLKKILKSRGYKVLMTRNRDIFIPLRKRTQFANDRKADLFVSIHANSVPKRKRNHIMGIESFFLSPARSQRAKRVAETENKVEFADLSINTRNSVLTFLNRSKIIASQKLAIDVQQHILYNLTRRYSKVVDGGVREAPFWVLVGAQMPAILVETGYISNPFESNRLENSTYQTYLARGIADGISAYFARNH